VVRVGIVLSKDGGALAEFLKTLQFGIAGIPGNGQQMMSWIHIEDVCRIFLHLIKNPSNDVYNAVADDPVSTNKLFDTILQFKKGIKVHIPSFLLKVILGEMSIEITKSAHISNAKIRAFGFDCKYPTIDQALADLLK
jgi:NAD dependent epimerase/dehydratase family enzyme